MRSSGNSRRPEQLHATSTMRVCIEAVPVIKEPPNEHVELWLRGSRVLRRRVKTRTGGMKGDVLGSGEEVEFLGGAVATSTADAAGKAFEFQPSENTASAVPPHSGTTATRGGEARSLIAQELRKGDPQEGVKKGASFDPKDAHPLDKVELKRRMKVIAETKKEPSIEAMSKYLGIPVEVMERSRKTLHGGSIYT
ncbi:hypothetical protein PC117_g13102 [Phytophthora cactorum]|uniref:Uncharacterized protein n=1 Tax=Phytophthora cactorum TaxID=29920 RepID=A0A8T1D1S5_9STRA|nr:hypothetical protein PC117_g13102 [Phytophthora cactorum]